MKSKKLFMGPSLLPIPRRVRVLTESHREESGRKPPGEVGAFFYQDFGLFYQDFGLFYQDFGRVWKGLGLSGTLGMCAVASRGMYHHPVRLFGRVLDPEVYTSQKP